MIFECVVSDYIKQFHMIFTMVHPAIPITVGIRKAAAVHLRLPVSFFMVRQVVEQGQWNREKTAMHR